MIEDEGHLYLWTDVHVDSKKHVEPIQVRTFDEKPKKAETLSEVASNYKILTKYSFSESGKYVKVLFDFPDAKNLIKKEQVQTNFEKRSFEIMIAGYKGENFKFAVPKLQCRICPPDCSWSLKSNNVQVSLRKKGLEDNWWSLFKQKAVGEKEGDSGQSD